MHVNGNLDSHPLATLQILAILSAFSWRIHSILLLLCLLSCSEKPVNVSESFVVFVVQFIYFSDEFLLMIQY